MAYHAASATTTTSASAPSRRPRRRTPLVRAARALTQRGRAAPPRTALRARPPADARVEEPLEEGEAALLPERELGQRDPVDVPLANGAGAEPLPDRRDHLGIAVEVVDDRVARQHGGPQPGERGQRRRLPRSDAPREAETGRVRGRCLRAPRRRDGSPRTRRT